MVARISDPGDRRVRKIVVLDKWKSFVQENLRFSQGWISEIPTDITPEIEGGDHHQFGSYLLTTEGDLATISREAQHAQILSAMFELLQYIAKG